MFSRLLDSPLQLTILLLVFLVLFGAKRLPGAARSVGRSMRIFNSEIKQLKADGHAVKADADDLASEAVFRTADDGQDGFVPEPGPVHDTAYGAAHGTAHGAPQGAPHGTPQGAAA